MIWIDRGKAKCTWDLSRGMLEGLCVDGRTILEWILNKYITIGGIRLIRLRLRITGEPL